MAIEKLPDDGTQSCGYAEIRIAEVLGVEQDRKAEVRSEESGIGDAQTASPGPSNPCG